MNVTLFRGGLQTGDWLSKKGQYVILSRGIGVDLFFDAWRKRLLARLI